MLADFVTANFAARFKHYGEYGVYRVRCKYFIEQADKYFDIQHRHPQ